MSRRPAGFARRDERAKLHRQIKDERRRIFLEEYARFGTQTTAAKIAGLSYNTIENWKKENPDFAAAMKEANQMLVERLEKCAVERATTGGSDPILMFLLKALDRNKYGERVRHEFAIKTLDAVVTEVLEAVRINVPEFCPHCRIGLDITPAIAKELTDMSARLTGQVREDEVVNQ